MTQHPGQGDSLDPRQPRGGEGSAQIEELLGQVDLLPFGPQGRALLDEALRLVQESGDEETEYRIRMRLISAAQMMGDTDGVLSNFAWCVSRNELDPSRFPTEVDEQDLLWFYKWIPASLAAHPTFARADILDALQNMQERYTREGVGQHGVLQARFSEAHRSGHMQEAEGFSEALLSAQRDDYSHCEACVRADQVDFALDQGRPGDALRYFDEIMEQGMTCGEEPEAVMSTVLLPLLRAGRLEDAERAHRMGYRLAKDNPGLMASIALHIEFAAITGNHARALSLLERHLGTLAHDELNINGHFSSLLSIAVAAEIIALAGHGELEVRGSGDPILVRVLGPHQGPYSVEQLARAAWAAAQPIGAAFDERNGTDRYARRLAEARSHVLESYPLALSEQQVERHERASDPAAEDVDGWTDVAVWAAVSDDGTRAEDAVRRALAAGASPRQRLALWGIRAALLEQEDRGPAIAERAAAYDEMGLADEAAFEREHGVLVAGVIGEEGAAVLTALLPQLPTAELRGRVHTELGLHGLAAGDAQQAMSHFLQGAEEADVAGDSETFRRALIGACWAVPLEEEGGALQTRLLDMAEAAGPRANQLYDVAYLRSVEAAALRDDRESAAQLSRAAADLAVAHRALGPLSQITRFRTELLTGMDRHLEAAAAQRVYSQMLREQGRPADVGMLVGEGRSLVHAGEMQDALEVLADAGRALEENEESTPGQWAVQDRWYGEAAEGCEYFGSAFEAWERALECGEAALAEAPELEDAQLAALEACMSARSLVALAQRAEEEDDVRNFGARALVLARALADQEHGLLPVTLQQLGRAYAGIGDELGLELLQEAEDLARAEDAGWFSADVLDTRGRSLLDLGRPDEAMPVLLRAADEYAAQGDLGNAALGEYSVARILEALERNEEALAVFSNALERVRDEPGQVRSGVAGAFGDLLEVEGRLSEAEDVRRLIQ